MNPPAASEAIPACLATDLNSPVVSVGAGTSAEDHEPYGNHGSWVQEWRIGTVASLMPLTGPADAQKDGNGYALWSGTSLPRPSSQVNWPRSGPRSVPPAPGRSQGSGGQRRWLSWAHG